MNLKKLTTSAVVMALYIALMYFTQSFSFGQYQIRIATGVYALAFHFPFLVLPLGLANALSNMLMGGLGIFDILGGFVIGIITSGGVVLIKKFFKNDMLSLLPIALFPSIIVPIWLSPILNVPYIVLFLSLLVGQTISAFTMGLILVKIKYLKNIHI